VIAEYLRSKGVADELLQISGHRETEPVASNETNEGRRTNRRVDLHLVPSSQSAAAGAPAERPPS
jgi:outer membrane protein OmpA-like peptidoglycan-associated protein